MNSIETIKMIGKSFPEEMFKVVEDHKNVNLEIVDHMLRGEGPPVYVVRNYLSNDLIKKLEARFHEIIDETNGGNRNNDTYVSVNQIGANQFAKTGKEFISESIQTKQRVNNFLEAIENSSEIDDFILESSFKSYFLEKNIYFGPSFYKGDYSNLFTVRLWKNQPGANLSLEAHEDLSQLNFAKRDGFEIKSVKNVIASNLCVDNDSETRLLLWNMCPDESVKVAMNLCDTGYPYPLDLLEDISVLRLQTFPGDLYFINANYLHGVEKSVVERRISLGRFMGYVNDKRVVYWT